MLVFFKNSSSPDVFFYISLFPGERLFWPVKRNARYPVWNAARIMNPRAAKELELGDVIVVRIYDWDDFKADDLIGIGKIKVDNDFLKQKRGPVTFKVELEPDAAWIAYLEALPSAAGRAVKRSPTILSRFMSMDPWSAWHTRRQDAKVMAKKNRVRVPPTEVTMNFTTNSPASTRKRVFFIVHSDSEADEAERIAADGRELQALMAKLHYDHGLSPKGIAAADRLRERIGASSASTARTLEQAAKTVAKLVDVPPGGRGDDKRPWWGERTRESAHEKKSGLDAATIPRGRAEVASAAVAQHFEAKLKQDMQSATAVFSSPQARCVQTAIVALVEHDALSAGTAFKDLDTLAFRCPVCRSKVAAFRDIGPRAKASGFDENLDFGLGVNRMTPGQKNVLIFGSLALGFAFFLSLYSLR